MNTSLTAPFTHDRIHTLDVELRCADGPDTEWKVHSCHIDEGIDRGYRAMIEASSGQGFDERDLLGGDCELVFVRGPDETRRLYGVISRVEQLGHEGGRQRFAIEVVPAIALLDQGQHSRIFQDKSAQDIIAEVLEAALAPYGRSVAFGSISRGAAAWDYCVQYRESDFDFVCRLLEEAGIAYEFAHEPDAGVELLQLRDANDQYPELENVDGVAEIPVIPSAADQAQVESIQAIVWVGQLTPTSSLRRDYDWHTPTKLLSEPAGEADTRGRERRIYTHVRRRFVHDDVGERVADRVAAEQLEAATLSGQSNATIMTPGRRFTLTNSNDDLEDEYLICAVSHELSQAPGEAPRYHNSFSCVPATLEWRPRPLTPKPRVHGPQTAIVVGDDEIHTDEHGRVQVQFHWEEQPSYASQASCWIRCAQSWAGPSWGAQFIPRVGMEVVVEFLEGNPDRPLLTGAVYNGDNAPPFAVPDSKTQSGWRTSSSPGGDGYNMLRFEDAAGNEEIHVHGQKDWTIVIENDKTQEVRHDEQLGVRHDRSKHVGHDEAEAIDNDRSIEVGNNHSESIGADMSLSVGNNQTVTVGSNRLEAIGANAVETVAGIKTVAVGGMLAVTVGDSLNTVVAASCSLGIAEAMSTTIGGSSSESVVGDKSVVADNIKQDAQTDMTVSVGKRLRMTAGDDFSISGDKQGVIDVAKQLVLKCGKASITLKKNGDIKIEGNKIEVKGKGDIKVKGKKVAIN